MHDASEPSPALPTGVSRDLIHTLNNQLSVVFAHLELAEDSQDPAEMRVALSAIAAASLVMADGVRKFSRATQNPMLTPRSQEPGH